MSEKRRMIAGAIMAVLVAGGASLALAQSAPERGTTSAISPARAAPVSRPVNGGRLRAHQVAIATPLSEAECTGLGGTVNTVDVKICDSGKGCATADKDGVMRGVCITKTD